MSRRVKYPITTEAKDAARQLVTAWDNKEVEQAFELYPSTAGNAPTHTFSRGLGTTEQFSIPKLGVLHELSQFSLIMLHWTVIPRWRATEITRLEITLLQELRNAVENDFEVSDFFLTTSAVGTIIHGDLTLAPGSLFQSGAAGIGDVTMTAENVSDELVRILGDDTLRQHSELAEAIRMLRTADQPTRREKAGNVISELGRALGHLSNTGGAITAISLIVRFLSGGGL